MLTYSLPVADTHHFNQSLAIHVYRFCSELLNSPLQSQSQPNDRVCLGRLDQSKSEKHPSSLFLAGKGEAIRNMLVKI